MKKYILLVTMVILGISSYAQTKRYDIRVRKETDYKDYGVKYKPTETKSQNAPDPYEAAKKNRELFGTTNSNFGFDEQAYEEGRKIVSDEIKLLNGINLESKQSFPVRARIVTRKNGRVEITCMGIKKGDSWNPCNKPINSLQHIYDNAKSESEKSMILELMDFGNYLLDTGNEMYVLK